MNLITKHCFPRAFDRSFDVSVFPVPAGPSGAPPNDNRKAPIYKNDIGLTEIITMVLRTIDIEDKEIGVTGEGHITPIC